MYDTMEVNWNLSGNGEIPNGGRYVYEYKCPPPSYESIMAQRMNVTTDRRIINGAGTASENKCAPPPPYVSIEGQPVNVITCSNHYNYKCCGLFPLKTGCLIIGYYNLVSAVCLIIAAFVGIIIGYNYMDPNNNTEKSNWVSTLVIFCSILVTFLVLHLIFSILLVVGVHKHKRGYVKAYAIYALLLFGMSVLITIINFIKIKYLPIGAFIFNLTQTCVSGYFLCIINLYTDKMRNDIRN